MWKPVIVRMLVASACPWEGAQLTRILAPLLLRWQRKWKTGYMKHHLTDRYNSSRTRLLPLYMAIPVGGIFLFFKQKELHCCMTKAYHQVSDGRLIVRAPFQASDGRMRLGKLTCCISRTSWYPSPQCSVGTSSFCSSSLPPSLIKQTQFKIQLAGQYNPPRTMHFLTTLSMIHIAAVQPQHFLTPLTKFTYLHHT
jgi:hypothetical protein